MTRASGTGRNVIAQTRTGDPGRVVMIGAHLDSVPKGPGIVDDGSGVASLLEIATRLGAEPSVQNTVRFAFFGNEETGAQGSSGYLEGLSTERPREDQAVSERGHGGLAERRLPRSGRQGQRRGGCRPRGLGQDRAGPRRPAGQGWGDRLRRSSSSSGTTNHRLSTRASRSAAPRTATRKRRRPSRPGRGAGRPARSTTAATTRLVTASTTSTGRCSSHYLRALAGTLAHFATSTDDSR